jgi:SAM-dependent methyltransferase
MWHIIHDKVIWTKKTVVDLGCGAGDMLWRAWDAGANRVDGIDLDKRMLKYAEDRHKQHGYQPPRAKIFFGCVDLSKHYFRIPTSDIVICFSVLPYIHGRHELLDQMSRRHDTAFIECQYWGDGPGPSDITTQNDMRELLRRYWKKVEWCGATTVKGGIAKRDIWRCQ